jgi:hypothetical protein
MLLIECVVHLCCRSPSPRRPGRHAGDERRANRRLDQSPQATGVACQPLITILNLYLATYVG